MLHELFIRNFAIINKLHLELAPELNVLTGETGAGKSILINAVEMLLGGRGTSDLIRTGSEEAVVEAVFTVPDLPSMSEILDSFDLVAGDEVLIKRVLLRSGRSRAFINGSPATATMLGRLGEGLIHIFGQQHHQGLLRAETHRELLDQFGGLEGVVERLGNMHRRMTSIRTRLHETEAHRLKIAQRLDLLQYQVEDIRRAALGPNEEADLQSQKTVIQNTERLVQEAEKGHRLLYAESGSVVEILSTINEGLRWAAGVDPTLRSRTEELEAIIYRLEDIASDLANYSTRLEVDPGRLDEIEERLAEIQKLKRKYHCASAEELLNLLGGMERELEELDGTTLQEDSLKDELVSIERELAAAADDLSRRRRDAAEEMMNQVERELSSLGMERTRFIVSLHSRADDTGEKTPGPAGWDQVEFLISPNVGEEPRPLIRIASGGELSRIMLALKRILAGMGAVPTLIFDEVDAGIGGGVAEVVGRKLLDVSKRHQVLVITHLHQIASLANAHYRVEKVVEGGRTLTRVTRLGDKERVDEIARMMGGVKITDATKRHAKELLERK
ncbi:MAG: DNA repair protein RecN [Deltaproteobacteria bacterium]|nr:DNA repair protein RecN [Deltaproteobacteria bacterium]MBW2309306.1 DNA repair protein RecN [Deltaproteobacteria bacterium]